MIYTDQARIEAYLNRSLTDDEGTIVEQVIEYLSNYLGSYLNRSYFSIRDEDGVGEGEDYASVASARIFDGEGKKEIYIDDFTGLTQIDFLDAEGSSYNTFTATTDWLLFPLNKNPKESIRMRATHFPNGYGNVQMTANWGSGACPAPVIMTATILVGKFFKKAEINKSTYKSESIEGYSYTLQSNADHDAEIKNALDMIKPYKKITL